MAKKPVNKKLSVRDYRSQLAKLKKAGLVSKKIDARSHKPTRHMLKQLEKYKDVVEGKAKAVKVRTRSEAREYADLHRAKFNRVVIRTQEGETARYNKRDASIRVKRQSRLPGIESVLQILRPKSDDKIPALPRDTKKKQYLYAIPFRVGNSIRRRYFNTQKELLKQMQSYDPKQGGRFKDWQDYIEIIEVEGLQNVESKKAAKTRASTNKLSRNDASGTKTASKKKAAKSSKARTPAKPGRNTRKRK